MTLSGWLSLSLSDSVCVFRQSAQVYRADLPKGSDFSFIKGLFLLPASNTEATLPRVPAVGERMTRARYPNCDDITGVNCYLLNTSGSTGQVCMCCFSTRARTHTYAHTYARAHTHTHTHTHTHKKKENEESGERQQHDSPLFTILMNSRGTAQCPNSVRATQCERHQPERQMDDFW